MNERNIAAEVLDGLHEISEHRAGRRSLRTVHVEPRPRPDPTPDPAGTLNPPHPGETIRFDCIEASGLTVTQAADLLGCSRPALSRLLNGHAGISPEMALAFERQGWSNADFWMRLQAAYDLAQVRRRVSAA